MNLSFINLIIFLIAFDSKSVSNRNDRPIAIEPRADSSTENDDRRGSPLTIADLDAYLGALHGDTNTEPAERVSFRDLWNRPDDYQGKRVEIEASIEQIFEQKAIGAFPDLIEIWGFSRVGDPFCLVYPRANESRRFERGTRVRFRGVFLKLLEYKARDSDRIAPLIVGAEPPTTVGNDASRNLRSTRLDKKRLDRAFTAIAIVFTILFILILMRGRTKRIPLSENDDPPRFVG